MIEVYNQYADVRRESSLAPAVHGLAGHEIDRLHSRMSEFAPQLAQIGPANRFRSLFDEALPEGASWSPTRTAQTLGIGGNPGGGRTMVTQQTPYQPEFASPDRQQYPVHRILANRYWRLFFKLDPVVGNCIELYSDLPWSNFELTGEGVEGDIRNAYEDMCRESQVLAMLPYFVREFLVVGECIPHTFFDDERGIFTYIAMHNPDQLEVIDAPFIKMDPILEFIPDDRLRAVLSAHQPSLQKIRDRIPPELLSKLQSRQNIPLSPINATFIPRKLHPYDTRGTSILSRLWRVLMLEDAIFNATIQTARRHAAPIKVAKLGNAATGWIPPPEQEKRLLELLAQAEQDPNAWLVYHYGIQFDTVGTTDRIMSVNREWDIIERIKLVALGISKSFLHGEVSYASSATGLQVFLQRLKSMRMFFEQKWLYPKFFRPIAQINGWIKPKPSELAHRFRIKRSQRELQEENRYIVPRIVWDKSLDPQINTSLIQAMQALEALGVKFSKTSKMATVGYSYEEETKKIHREIEFEKTFLPQPPASAPAAGGPGGAPMMGGEPPPPGGPGGTPPPGGEGKAPPGADGKIPPGINPPPAASKVQADNDSSQQSTTNSSHSSLKSTIWTDDKYGNWAATEVGNLVDLVNTLDTDDAFWAKLGTEREFKQAVLDRDRAAVWSCIDRYLEDQGYPDSDIRELQTILEAEGVILAPESVQTLERIENSLSDGVQRSPDDEFVAKVQQAIVAQGPLVPTNDTFLSGVESPSARSNLDGNLIPRES
jgi:hypothetical protein